MLPEIEKPLIANQFPDLVMAQSTRYGGVSEGNYASLNLGLHTEDSPGAVRENRKRFWDLFGMNETDTAGGYQVHGSEIKKVITPGYFDGYDAFVTNQRGILLSVTVADCVPVLIFDPTQKAVGAVHAGWRGTVSQIVRKTVEKLNEEYGSHPGDCVAYIGTSIGFDSFEVSEEVAVQFSDKFKKTASAEGKWLVDLKAFNRHQLIEAGLASASIELSPFCTVQDHNRFFSYRKEGGVTGRMLAVAGIAR